MNRPCSRFYDSYLPSNLSFLRCHLHTYAVESIDNSGCAASKNKVEFQFTSEKSTKFNIFRAPHCQCTSFIDYIIIASNEWELNFCGCNGILRSSSCPTSMSILSLCEYVKFIIMFISCVEHQRLVFDRKDRTERKSSISRWKYSWLRKNSRMWWDRRNSCYRPICAAFAYSYILKLNIKELCINSICRKEINDLEIEKFIQLSISQKTWENRTHTHSYLVIDTNTTMSNPSIIYHKYTRG